MKITVLFLACLCLMCACKPSGREETRSPAQQRQEKVARYLQKARKNEAKQRERSKPLVPAAAAVPQPPVVPGELNELPPEMQLRKELLEARLRAAYGEEAASRAGELILLYHREAMAALQKAGSAEEMARLLAEIEARHQERLNAFMAAEQEKVWVRPNAAQLNVFHQEMEARVAAMTAELEKRYGSQSAEKAQEFLKDIPMAAVQAFGRAQSREEFEAAGAEIFSSAQKRLQTVVLEYGDPLFSLPEEEVKRMREELTNEYRPLEKKVQALYGRRATLQLKALFSQFLEGVTETARTESRASEKSARIEQLNRIYQQKVSGLQEDLNRRIAASKKSRGAKSGKAVKGGKDTVKNTASAAKKK